MIRYVKTWTVFLAFFCVLHGASKVCKKRHKGSWTATMNAGETYPTKCENDAACNSKYCKNPTDLANCQESTGVCECLTYKDNNQVFPTVTNHENCALVGTLKTFEEANAEHKANGDSCSWLCWTLAYSGPNGDGDDRGSKAYKCSGTNFCYCEYLYYDKKIGRSAL